MVPPTREDVPDVDRGTKVDRFVVGIPPSALGEGDHLIALDFTELRSAAQYGVDATPFHEVFHSAEMQPANEVLIHVPTWRGYNFFRFLEWLVCARLAVPGSSEVTWRAARKGGAGGLKRILDGRGWELAISRHKGVIQYVGRPPAPGPRIEPACFKARLDDRSLTFAADWGVFSGGHIDPGSLLLLKAAASSGPVEVAVDVGSGYGPMAIGLVASGVAGRTVATEVDSVALALTIRNAETARASMEPILHEDPTTAPAAPLVVCAFPTHLERGASNRLLQALCRRALSSAVFIAVHASLEDRFLRRVTAEGATASVVARTTHSVLTITAARS
jgi:16S rRNA G1207 methylase RsmC